ncbi:RHS repeat-associated core domain-containing protein [Streptomyces niveus]|uniref:RHS repeat-associated core domain-containing protein n=1 Tax=Streptomyces niveus TaxID=193462 RepID=UPI00366615BA
MRTGGTSYYYLTDATGNVLGLVNDTGTRTHTYDYSPTGVPRPGLTETVVQPYRFAGAFADPTGLYKMGARYYDRNLGRFTQPDPSGQDTNAYLYAGGDPVNNTDPTGLWTAWDTVATGVAAVALVTAIPAGGASLTVIGGIGLAVSQTGFVSATACGVYDDNPC